MEASTTAISNPVDGNGPLVNGIKESPGSVQYSEIELETATGQDGKKKKQPRRILHFSDGILEEYSTDEEEDTVDAQPPVDPWYDRVKHPRGCCVAPVRTLNWLPWFWYYCVAMASGALGAADFCGEKLAWLFGITSPKYQYAIDEHYRMQKEEEEEAEREEREKAAERERFGSHLSKLEGGTVCDGNRNLTPSSDTALTTTAALNKAFEPEKF